MLVLAEAPQALNSLFCHLRKLRKHQILCFAICGSSASIKFFVLSFAEAPQALNFLFCHLRKLSKHSKNQFYPLGRSINAWPNAFLWARLLQGLVDLFLEEHFLRLFCRMHNIHHVYARFKIGFEPDVVFNASLQTLNELVSVDGHHFFVVHFVAKCAVIDEGARRPVEDQAICPREVFNRCGAHLLRIVGCLPGSSVVNSLVLAAYKQ